MNERRSFARPERPGSPQEAQSQIALELVLNLYAVLGALVVVRSLLLALRVDDRVWIGRSIYGVTRLIEKPFTYVPGSAREILGNFTLADLTLLAGVILFPLGILAAKGRFSRANRGGKAACRRLA
ncbi:MAG: hypothetical protein ACR2OO_16385 [Thermomicrobiales bacterium]